MQTHLEPLAEPAPGRVVAARPGEIERAVVAVTGQPAARGPHARHGGGARRARDARARRATSRSRRPRRGHARCPSGSAPPSPASRTWSSTPSRDPRSCRALGGMGPEPNGWPPTSTRLRVRGAVGARAGGAVRDAAVVRRPCGRVVLKLNAPSHDEARTTRRTCSSPGRGRAPHGSSRETTNDAHCSSSGVAPEPSSRAPASTSPPSSRNCSHGSRWRCRDRIRFGCWQTRQTAGRRRSPLATDRRPTVRALAPRLRGRRLRRRRSIRCVPRQPGPPRLQHPSRDSRAVARDRPQAARRRA